MHSRAPLKEDFRVLFKRIDGVIGGGCSVEVWLPKPLGASLAPLPLAIVFHGGGFFLGTSSMIPFNSVRYLLSKGIAVASFEYRFAPHASLPEIRADLLDAYRYVQDGINQDLFRQGCLSRIDGSRCFAMGYSAGGSSALYLAGDLAALSKTSEGEGLSPLRAVVPVYAISNLDVFSQPQSAMWAACEADPDLREAWAALQAEPCSSSFLNNPETYAVTTRIWKDLVGDKARTASSELVKRIPPRLICMETVYKLGCLSSLLLRCDAPFPSGTSPIDLIGPGYPPTCVVAAPDDEVVPFQQSLDLLDKLKEQHIECNLVRCVGMKHGEAECLPGHDWDDAWWDQAIRPSLDFASARL